MSAGSSPDVRAAFRSVPLLADLDDAELDWFVAQCELRDLADGEVLARPGDPSDRMFVVLAGQLQAHPENGAVDEGRVYAFRAGEVTGMLPFSRMTRIPRMVRAAAPTRIAGFPASCFPEMLRRIPGLEPRLVAVLADRVRHTTRTEQQRDRLVSLGRLSAGLAHELNNPAAAVQRGAKELQRALAELAERSTRVGQQVEARTLEELTRLRGELTAGRQHLSTLERGDREDELAAWLEQRGVPDAWSIAPALVDAGADAPWLDRVARVVLPERLPLVLGWLEAGLRAEDLLRTVQQASARISGLVAAVKEYTFMDQAPVQEIEVNAGIESTVRMLSHKLARITVVRRYAPDLPRILAHAAELNQVWTNLIDNAADALEDGGEIVLTTGREDDAIVVEVRDDGPGIPPEAQPHLFDPFYTTKAVGKGTGLGLDIVRRIVEQHQGGIRVESEPGATRFVVRLPISAARA